ncbi:MAG: hypothetical protein ACOYVK_18965 [Bacillota bacterium]
MEPLGFFLGVATFGLATRLRKPIRKAAVFTTSQAFSLVDALKTSAYSIKEEVEDIVAEAHYENLKKKVGISKDHHEDEEQHS